MARADLIWVSCSREDDFGTSTTRHLIPAFSKGKPGVTTLCGATGVTGLEFRKNSSKPACVVCASR